MPSVELCGILDKHEDTIVNIVFSSDGRLCASLSVYRDPMVRIWDTSTWEVVQQIQTNGEITSIGFNQQGTILVGSGFGDKIFLWNIQNEHVEIIQVDLGTHRVRLDEHANPFIYSYKDGKSFFYNLETRINSELIALDNRYTPFINFGGWLRRNLKQIACESQNYGISLWNIADKSLDRTLYGHSDSINAVIFQGEDGLISASDDKTVRIWDLKTGETRKVISTTMSCIWEIHLRPNSSTLLIVNEEDIIECWDLSSDERYATLRGHGSHLVAALSPDGTLLAVGSDDCQIKLWRFQD